MFLIFPSVGLSVLDAFCACITLVRISKADKRNAYTTLKSDMSLLRGHFLCGRYVRQKPVCRSVCVFPFYTWSISVDPARGIPVCAAGLNVDVNECAD